MWYNLILAGIIAVAVISAFLLGQKVFYAGFITGHKASSGEKIPEFKPKKAKKVKESAEMKRNRQILANIEKFDGLSDNQEDIK